MTYCATLPEVLERPPKTDKKFKDFLNTLKEPVPIQDEPPMWACILHNDNTTLPRFVVGLLVDVFGLSTVRAMRVMMTAHENGHCVVTVDTKERLETLLRDAARTIQHATFQRHHTNPNGGCELRFSMQEETSNEKRTGS